MSASNYSERLLEAMEARGKDTATLARDLQISYQAVRKALAGGRLGTENHLKAVKLLRVNSEWLASGIGLRDAHPNTGVPELQPVQPGKIKGVPVVGTTAGGNLPERIWTDGDFPVGHTDAFAEVASADPQAFIVRVVGSSMIPKYTPGEFALVEPATVPDLEDDVLVRLVSGQTLLKRLLSKRGGYIRLGSYNEPDVLVYSIEEVTWMYYVPYPVPARKIKTRI